MRYFIIGYGLSGGFGGIRDYDVIEADSQDEASEIAYESTKRKHRRVAEDA